MLLVYLLSYGSVKFYTPNAVFNRSSVTKLKSHLDTSMRSIRIYQNSELSPGVTASLDESATRHIGQVLRMSVGDEVVLFNGNGFDYPARITNISKKHIEVHLQAVVNNDTESGLIVHLFQGISKGDRMDTAIQKSVELGVNFITPIICEHTVARTSRERTDKKLAHWMNIIINACEQSGRAKLPELLPVESFESAINDTEPAQTLMLHPNQLISVSNVPLEKRRINLLIGPEGGFSEHEIKVAEDKCVRLVSMGKRILRTETAPVAALSVLQSRFGDY